MNIAIITGASSGLGREFIKYMDNENLDEIWAIARRKDRLAELQALVNIPIRPIDLDLTQKESIDTIEELLKKNLRIYIS